MSYLDVMEVVKGRYKPDQMKGINAVYQFDLPGEGGGAFYIDVKDGEADFVDGKSDRPNITIHMELEDFKKWQAGKLNPATALMLGKIKMKGDMVLGMKLRNIMREQ